MKDGLGAMLLVNLFEQDGQSGAFTLSVARRVELDILVAEILVDRLGILSPRPEKTPLPIPECSPATIRRGW